MTQKIRVAVLFGGRSAEHEVSLQSAKNVIQQLDSEKFEVIPIGINKQGHWLLCKEVFEKSLAADAVPQLIDHSEAWFAPEWVHQTTAKSPVPVVQDKISNGHFDVVFPVMHGTLCEDGTLQGLLELADVPYVGCDVLSSAIGMRSEEHTSEL